MKNAQAAYEAAAKLDKQVNALLASGPISAENWQHWTLFARTIQTTVDHISWQVGQVKRGTNLPPPFGPGE